MQHKVFGCKVNKYYTDKWLSSEFLQDKTGIFLASCVVTDKAKRKWVRFVKQNIKNLTHTDRIYISGCGAFEAGKENEKFFTVYPELSDFREKIVILPESPEQKKSSHTPGGSIKNLSEKIEKIHKIHGGLYTKKFVLIQGGCDSYCTFCLTVIKRGKHFYRAKEDILEEILDFQRQDGKEVVLTGVNLCAWGLENTNTVGKSRFAELLEYLLKNTDIPRIRISSLGPEFIDAKVLKVFENPRIYPHFHFSIQSGSDDILKSMRRHYDGKYIRNLLKKTKNIPRKDGIEISLGADLIVGFPGETDTDFESTLELVRDFGITKLHAFPFSSHQYGEHVPAFFYKNQIDETIKKQRLHTLLAEGEKQRDVFIATQVGKKFEVLIEKVKGGEWSGWTQNYIQVDETNFLILEGKVKRNTIITGIFQSKTKKKTADDTI